MIQLNEGICYSPAPNSAYWCEEYVKGGGLATLLKDDLQVWNLAWLSDPTWDMWLQVQTVRDVIEVLRPLDTTLVGLARRALTMEDDIEDWGTPPLRDLLKLPPRDFMRQFSKKDIMCLELTATYGQPLIQTMWSRARLSQPITADTEVAQFVERAMGNVIPFRKREKA